MKILPSAVSLLFLTLLSLAAGCEQGPEGWTPVLEETSTVFMELETQRLMGHVQRAIETLESDPQGARAELRDAESTLEHLLDYYLPLVDARERAYNAYRRFFLEDEAGVAEDLAEIEEILTEMAENAEGQRLLEIESLGESVATTRMATAAGGGQGQEALESLARRLNQAALKGDLILKR